MDSHGSCGGFDFVLTWPTEDQQEHQERCPVGLKNCGDTCFANSVFQCLTYTPPLAVYCLEYLPSSSTSAFDIVERSAFDIVANRIKRSLTLRGTCDTPSLILSSLRVFNNNFMFRKIIDPHEYLKAILTSCIKENSIIKDLFESKINKNLYCLSCKVNKSSEEDKGVTLSLDISDINSLGGAVDGFFKVKYLDPLGGNECLKECTGYRNAVVETSFGQAPVVLVIHLKRFEEEGGKKINHNHISFEELLEVSSNMGQVKDLKYNLVALIVHEGDRADSGHYCAYIKNAGDKWYCCDDSKVTISTFEEVKEKEAYILFFSKQSDRKLEQIEKEVE